MSDTIPAVRTAKIRCGFCLFPSADHPHGFCPIATLQGDGSLLACGCSCTQDQIKCLDCGIRESASMEDGEVDPSTWRCIDRDACAARVQHRKDSNPTWQMLQSIRTQSVERVQEERTEARVRQVRIATGRCLHCGEPTKGGLFLPGHDAAYLAATVRQVREGLVTLPEADTDWAERGISEALRGKLAKRVAA